MESTTNKKEKDNRLVIILGILLGISIVGNIYLLNRSKSAEGKVIEEHAQVDSLNSFKLALENDFEAMTFELDQFKGKNIQLDSLLEKANNDIAKQKQKIDKLVKENKDIDLLKRQFAEMKAIRDGYRQQIDQLIKENKELRFANINLSQEVDDLNKTKKDLSQKVELASVLKAESIDVKALREKGKGKLEVTEKAKRVSRISTTFVVAENKVAPKGERDVVLRILKPDGYVLTDPNNASGNFTKEDGRSSEFTLRKKIQYNNNREEVVFDWDQLEELKAGLYISEIYLDGKFMGNYKFNLK
jgi:predicted  nucleic acid-binding Zn-ribbon protein